MDLSFLLAIALIIALIFWLNRHQSRRQPAAYRSPTATAAPSRSVRGQTQRQLLRLVGGNQSVAERLVEQVKLRNPSQSEQWCWEKAIYDIHRDRHSS